MFQDAAKIFQDPGFSRCHSLPLQVLLFLYKPFKLSADVAIITFLTYIPLKIQK